MRLGKSRQAWLFAPNSKRQTPNIANDSDGQQDSYCPPYIPCGCAVPEREVRAVQVASALDDHSQTWKVFVIVSRAESSR